MGQKVTEGWRMLKKAAQQGLSERNWEVYASVR